MIFDIHTHTQLHLSGTAIVNCLPDEFVPREGEWYSVGIHPWRVLQETDNVQSLLPLLRHPQVLAVGEAGLDKLATAPLSVQMEVFAQQARMADEVGKPLIIHLVKATDELLKLKRELQPRVPWIVHGFRGKAALAEELLRHGLYLSFGEKFQAEALHTIPDGRLFMETDESEIPIETLYARAAEVRGTTPERLMETVTDNIGNLVTKGTIAMVPLEPPRW